MLLQDGSRRQSSRPALPSFRDFSCGACGCSAVVCQHCDRGQRYCPNDRCAATGRAAGCLRHRLDYQRTPKGRRSHARAQARWRLRHELRVLEAALARPADEALAIVPVEGADADFVAPSQPCSEPGCPKSVLLDAQNTDGRDSSAPNAERPPVDAAESGVEFTAGEVGTPLVMDHPSTTSEKPLLVGPSETQTEEPTHEPMRKATGEASKDDGIRICGFCKRPCGPFIHFFDYW